MALRRSRYRPRLLRSDRRPIHLYTRRIWLIHGLQKTLLDKVELPEDDCQAIATAISQGTAKAISDGSFDPDTLKGTSALIIPGIWPISLLQQTRRSCRNPFSSRNHSPTLRSNYGLNNNRPRWWISIRCCSGRHNHENRSCRLCPHLRIQNANLHPSNNSKLEMGWRPPRQKRKINGLVGKKEYESGRQGKKLSKTMQKGETSTSSSAPALWKISGIRKRYQAVKNRQKTSLRHPICSSILGILGKTPRHQSRPTTQHRLGS